MVNTKVLNIAKAPKKYTIIAALTTADETLCDITKQKSGQTSEVEVEKSSQVLSAHSSKPQLLELSAEIDIDEFIS